MNEHTREQLNKEREKIKNKHANKGVRSNPHAIAAVLPPDVKQAMMAQLEQQLQQQLHQHQTDRESKDEKDGKENKDSKQKEMKDEKEGKANESLTSVASTSTTTNTSTSTSLIASDQSVSVSCSVSAEGVVSLSISVHDSDKKEKPKFWTRIVGSFASLEERKEATATQTAITAATTTAAPLIGSLSLSDPAPTHELYSQAHALAAHAPPQTQTQAQPQTPAQTQTQTADKKQPALPKYDWTLPAFFDERVRRFGLFYRSQFPTQLNQAYDTHPNPNTSTNASEPSADTDANANAERSVCVYDEAGEHIETRVIKERMAVGSKKWFVVSSCACCCFV